jgi:hypothetical protein
MAALYTLTEPVPALLADEIEHKMARQYGGVARGPRSARPVRRHAV